MQKKIKLLIKKIWPILFLILISLITFFLLIELSPKPQTIAYLDKIQHAFIFIILTIFGTIAWKPHRYWLASALILYGAFTELLQGLLTITRTASFGDWLADIVGIAIGLLIFAIIQKNLLKISHERRI